MGHCRITVCQPSCNLGDADGVVCFSYFPCVAGSFLVSGVFLSWFGEHHTFGNEPAVSFGWVAGVAISTGFWLSPFTSYICKVLPLRGTAVCFLLCFPLLITITVNLFIAQTILALGFILAGQSRTVWQFALTQGVMCGMGIGLVRRFCHKYRQLIVRRTSWRRSH